MVRNLILSGGVAHPYEVTSPMLAEILGADEVVSDVSEAWDRIAPLEECAAGDWDLLTLNRVKWTCSQTPKWYDKWHFELPRPLARACFG